ADCPQCPVCSSMALPFSVRAGQARRSEINADSPRGSDPAGLFRGLPGSLAALVGQRPARWVSLNVVDFPYVVTGPLVARVDLPQGGNRPRCWRTCRAL